MKIVCIDGFNSYLGQNFYNKYKKKYKIVRFKSDINNIKELENFIDKKRYHFLLDLLDYQDQIVKKIKKNVIVLIMKQIKNLLII